MIDAEAGSSPRGRGKRGRRRKGQHVRRLIPARAGKTTCLGLRTSATPAHPRAGGENFFSAPSAVLICGSSPRGRGKQLQTARQARRRRLIPARAGKTASQSSSICRVSAHPRAGGENTFEVATLGAPPGSSPRGRGKPVRMAFKAAPGRLIPARAGKTAPDGLSGPISAAHPRAGGENCYNTNGNKGVTGSSPRGRGKPVTHRGDGAPERLIPARAGKTSGR